ncbi:MAG: hypothetical protein SFV54_11805 [Bryobacteraceae bacterium]|nr:hypothetical protein [Bryobacteraceae bacterium]
MESETAKVVRIVLRDEDPPKTTAKKGDQVYWENRTGARITQFLLPDCVSPQIFEPLDDGQRTDTYAIRSDVGANSYPYFYKVVQASLIGPLGTRNGTIDVS